MRVYTDGSGMAVRRQLAFLANTRGTDVWANRACTTARKDWTCHGYRGEIEENTQSQSILDRFAHSAGATCRSVTSLVHESLGATMPHTEPLLTTSPKTDFDNRLRWCDSAFIKACEGAFERSKRNYQVEKTDLLKGFRKERSATGSKHSKHPSRQLEVLL